MPKPTDLDLELVRAPLAGDSAVGVNLRADGSFDAPLRNLRDEAKKARSKERDARDGKEGKTPEQAGQVGLDEWRTIRTKGFETLCTRSKDVDVAALLIEALLRTDDIGGLAIGFQICQTMLKEHWEGILARARTPEEAGGEALPDEEAIPAALSMLAQLNENDLLKLPIGYTSIARASGGEVAYWQYQFAENSTAVGQGNDSSRVKLLQLDEIKRIVAGTDVGFLVTKLADLSAAKDAILELDKVLAEKLGEYTSYGPSFTNVLSALEDVAGSIRHLAKDRLPVAATAGPGSPATAGGGELQTGTPQSRDQAFQQLLAIADFFAQSEPLSLLAEQIRQVVHRGRLRPEEYYSELIESDDVLQRFFRTVGIRPRSQDSGS